MGSSLLLLLPLALPLLPSTGLQNVQTLSQLTRPGTAGYSGVWG